MSIPKHRREIDWLRGLAFGSSVPLHPAIPFIPGGIPLIQNSQTSEVLTLAVAWLHAFGLPLLLLIAGMGVFKSLENAVRATCFENAHTGCLFR